MGGDPAFEMLAVRSRPTGFEIEFTKPVDTAVAKLASSYTVQSYHMTPNSSYGGGSKLGSKTLVPKSILFSPDRRKVFLALDSLVASTPTQMRVVQIRLNNYKSSTGDNPWNTETWYTLNALGTGTPFDLPVALRTPLSESPAAGEVRWIVRQGNLHVRTPAAAGAIVRLRGVNGALLAELSPSGTGEHTLALGAAPARFAILEVTGEGFRLRRLIELH
jgi:hypothetical protein